jgi:hypothetical protein
VSTYREWEEALQSAYSIARGERLAWLKGRRPRSFDGRGLHPFSLEVGRIHACESIEPALREAGFDHNLLRAVAERDATEMFVEDINREGWDDGPEGTLLRSMDLSRRSRERP